MVLYMYKVFIGLCPNPGFERFPYNPRCGWKVEVKQNRRAEPWVQNLRNASFFSVAPKLFNSLPLGLRSFVLPAAPTKKHVEEFKGKLDEWLWCIPDQPGSIKDGQRLADSNSILDQMQYYIPPRRERTENENDNNDNEEGQAEE